MSKSLADAIFEAELFSTKKEKFEALSGLGEDDLFLVWECFNPYRVFNVRKYDEPSSYSEVDAPYHHFFSLLNTLAERSVTGNLARKAVTDTLSLYTERTAKALKRVLNKDLDCGANRDTFEKIYPDLNIPRFDIMLAAKIDEKNESRKAGDVVLSEEILLKKYKLSFPMIAESKYDGNRLASFVVDSTVTYNSRSGKESKHLIGLFDDELSLIEKEIGEPIVVDGEVLASSFIQTQNAKGSDSDEAKAALKFYVFDMMTKREWDNSDCKTPQHERSRKLEEVINKLGLKKIIKSKYKIVNTFKELQDFFSEVIKDGHDEDGNLNGLGEGLIIKRYDGLYQWDRSKNWFKWKPVIDLDLQIVGYEMGKGRLAATIGKLLLRGYDENGTLIEAKCGSGLNDKMRKYFLENQDELLGSTVMIECQEICIAQNGTIHSARFPIFKKIRDDK